jgi:hypothetical protein
MEKKAKGLLPKVEFIIIIVFLLSFVVWLIPKCGGDPDLAEELPNAETDLAAGGDSTVAKATVDSTQQAPKPKPAPKKDPIARDYTRLYVTIDGLNLRENPELNSEVLVRLPLFEEVYFLNEMTDSTTQVNLGYEVADEPWVKVRTKKGMEGWVYGAGVHYHKKKRSGVLE